MQRRFRMNNPNEIRRTLTRIARMVFDGEMDIKRANCITVIANAILGSIRLDEQQKKIEELEELIEALEEEKRGDVF